MSERSGRSSSLTSGKEPERWGGNEEGANWEARAPEVDNGGKRGPRENDPGSLAKEKKGLKESSVGYMEKDHLREKRTRGGGEESIILRVLRSKGACPFTRRILHHGEREWPRAKSKNLGPRLSILGGKARANVYDLTVESRNGDWQRLL